MTLRVSSMANEMGEMAAARYPAFTAQHPNVTVQFENVQDYSTKLIVLAAAGGLGDLAMIYLSSGAYHYLVPTGALGDHTALIARDKYDLKQFYATAIDAIRVNKKLYGLPFKAQNSSIGLFWNVDLFEVARTQAADARLDVRRPGGRGRQAHPARGDGGVGGWQRVGLGRADDHQRGHAAVGRGGALAGWPEGGPGPARGPPGADLPLRPGAQAADRHLLAADRRPGRLLRRRQRRRCSRAPWWATRG